MATVAGGGGAGASLDAEGSDGALGRDEHVGPLAGDNGPAVGEHAGDRVGEVGPGEGDRAGDDEQGGLAGGNGRASGGGAVACPMHGSTWGVAGAALGASRSSRRAPRPVPAP
jgi:hypothetical protein